MSETGVSGNSLLPYKFVGNSHEFIRQTGIPAHPCSGCWKQTMSFGFHYCPAQISEADLKGEKLVDVHRLWVASGRLEPIRSSLGLSWHQRTFEEKRGKD